MILNIQSVRIAVNSGNFYIHPCVIRLPQREKKKVLNLNAKYGVRMYIFSKPAHKSIDLWAGLYQVVGITRLCHAHDFQQ